MSTKLKDEELFRRLKEVYAKFGYISRYTMRVSGYDDGIYNRHFGSMNHALELVGIDPIKNKLIIKSTLGVSKTYTDDYLLQRLRDYIIEFDRIPTTREIGDNPNYPNDETYRKRFGNFKNALIKANIEIPDDKKWLFEREEYSKEELLKALKEQTEIKLTNSLYLLTTEDVDNIKEMPSMSSYYSKFKSLKEAYLELCIDYDKFNINKLEEDMKQKYINIRKMLGRTPHSRDLNNFSKNNNKYYNTTTYINHFTSMQNLQKIMGDEPFIVGKNMSKDEMLIRLRKLRDDLGIVPTQNDLQGCKYTPCCKYYSEQFGSFTNAIVEAGMTPRYVNTNLITPKGNIALSGYEYKFLLMLEQYKIDFKKEEYYKKYIKDYKRKHRFDFVINYNGKTYFIEIFGMMARTKYREKAEYKINLCKENNLKLIDLYPDDILNTTIDKLYTQLLSVIEDLD